jgi:organic radical activating enzyme
LNECYGPVAQGEGVDIGKPCLFIRTQGCPTRCVGCDSAYTWNGTEKGEQWSYDTLETWVRTQLREYPGCGIVLTGGEPLIHYDNPEWRELLTRLKHIAQWLSMETSAYIGKKQLEDSSSLTEYLRLFTTVHCSPKITPCFHGPLWQFEDMDVNLHHVYESFIRFPHKLVFKYVVRDEVDLGYVRRHVELHRLKERGHTICLMPFGIHRDEVAAGCERLTPWCARYGYQLSPRVHTLIHGNARAV